MAEKGIGCCVLCLETFKDPRILPICGHTFCLNCLKQYGASKVEKDLSCPICRRMMRVPIGGLENLPKNFSLCDVLENRTAAEHEGHLCSKHRDKELQLYCLDCSQFICLDCVDGGHGSHCLLTVSRMAANARIRLQGEVKRVNEKLLHTIQERNQIKDEKKKLLSMFSDLELAIETEFQKAKSYLERQKRTLDLELMTVRANLLRPLEVKERDVEIQEVLLTSGATYIEKVIDATDEGANFKVVETCKDLNSKSWGLMQMNIITAPEICSTTSVTFKPTDLLNENFFAIEQQQNVIGAIEVKTISSTNGDCAKQLQLPISMQDSCGKRPKLAGSLKSVGNDSNRGAPLDIRPVNRAPDCKASFQSSFVGKGDGNGKQCFLCMTSTSDRNECPCKTKFCRKCAEFFFNGQLKCQVCGKVFISRRGVQPAGTMAWRESIWQQLPGYNDCGVIEIVYHFSDGIQGENHPNPGDPYKGTHMTAYLPENNEGRVVLRLLKRAFDAGLVFTIGRSSVIGQDNVVCNISHKTTPFGKTGYPDATYLNLVKAELAAKGFSA